MIDSAGLSQRASAYLLVTPLLQSDANPPMEDGIQLETSSEAIEGNQNKLNLDLPGEVPLTPQGEYVLLQQRIYRAAIIASILVVAVSAFVFDLSTTISLMIGALSGLFYLRLLARSVGQLGKTSKHLSKVQLLVPITLVLVASRLPELELFPCLIGFLLYKPSLVFQVLLES